MDRYTGQGTVSIIGTKDGVMLVSGLSIADNVITSDVASCLTENTHWTCTAKSFAGATILAGSYIPFVGKLIYVGTTQSGYSSIHIIDSRSTSTDTLRTVMYTSTKLSSLTLLHVESPPVFIGSFVAGTCASTAGVNYIFTGMVHSDSGVMTGMCISSISGSILNSAELVNAMALEYDNPDSFIAGGLQLSDGAGLRAYLLCVNSLYRRIIYGMRYIQRTRRRMLLEGSGTITSVVKGMVRIENFLYLLVNVASTRSLDAKNSGTMLETDMSTGNIIQQVHIVSNNASIQCNDITASPNLFLVMACTVQYPGNVTQAIVMSVNRELTFSKIPTGFVRLASDAFMAESVAFTGRELPLQMRRDGSTPTEYTFSIVDRVPTIHPSVGPTLLPSSQPSSAPSGQPSSSPTAAPSVSPQPTSHPSSSGPTNTYKPTVKSTQRPTPVPSLRQTAKPSCVPSLLPTARPSFSPTTHPSTKTTTVPSSTGPTPVPSTKPTRHPTVRGTRSLTAAPTVDPTILGTSQKDRSMYRVRESMILGQVVGGLFILFCVYQLYWWWQYKLRKLKEDKKRVKEMIAQDLPGKPRYPIFSAIVNLCYDMEIAEDNDCAADNGTSVYTNAVNTTNTAAVAVTSTDDSLPPAAATNTDIFTYQGQGANMDGPVGFVDLEANIGDDTHGCSGNCGDSYVKKTEIKQEGLLSTAPATAITPVGGEVSDLSDASSASEESADASDSEHSDKINNNYNNNNNKKPEGSAESGSYVSGESWEIEPSDYSDDDVSDVVYTISSSASGNKFDGNEKGDRDEDDV